MSQHNIPARSSGIEVTVGWDNPLSTYYAIVSTVPEEADEAPRVLLWLGSHAHDFLHAEEMVGPLAAYAELTAEMITTLRNDRAAATRTAP